MNGLQRLSTSLSKPTRNELISKLFTGEFDDSYDLQLVVTFSSANVNINELASYLGSIYKIDGLLHGKGYRSYVRKYDNQIEFTHIREGSVVTEIERIITSTEAFNLFVIGFFLRGLPKLASGLAQSASVFYEALNKREDYLEKREKRRLRQDIRRILSNDIDLAPLSPTDRNKLAKLLGELYEANITKLNAMVRFAQKYVTSVALRTKRR